MDHNEYGLSASFQILLLVAFLIPAVIFLLTQQRTLSLIRPANRRMRPWLVWLQLIPYFGLVWQFVVVTKISNSIRDELNSPVDDSIFGDVSFSHSGRPTHNAGISYAALTFLCLITLPMLRGLAAFAGLGFWIVYWVQLSRYKKQLKERALLLNTENR